MSAGPFDQEVVEWTPSQLGREESPGAAAEESPAEVADGEQPAAAEAATAEPDPSATADREEEREEGPSRPAWTGGGFAPYEVGDPGRAAREVVAPPSLNPSDPADTQIDAVQTGPLTVRAASVRGISHRHEGTPRQDDYAVCATDDGSWLVVAVADGVSAGSHSHQAATIACRTAGTLVRDALATGDPASLPWDDVLSGIARRIVIHGRRVVNDGQPDDVSPKEVARTMATTLVVAVVATAPTDEGRHEGALLALGDTSAFVLGVDGAWQPVTDVKNDGAAVASSATVALPYLPKEPVSPLPFEIGPGEALFVMTDGVGDPLGRGDGDVGRFLGGEWASPPDAVSFAGQVGFARRSYDDDRTTVGVWVAP